MRQHKYTAEERKGHIISFLIRKEMEPGYSLRRYACENGIRYYTLRDWWRSEETNPRWMERYPECPSPSMMSLPESEEPIVVIGG